MTSKTLFIFEEYDQNFSEELSHILVDNLCDLLDPTLDDALIQKCED